MTLSGSWKAILAFVALVLTNLSANLAVTDSASPHTTSQWVTLLVSTVVGTFAVWAKANEPNG